MENNNPAGQYALYKMLEMAGPLPHTLSEILPREGRRRTVIERDRMLEFHPLSARPEPTLKENLRFAFKHEALDLRVIHAVVTALGPQNIASWVQEEPTGRFSRLAWFYFERLTGTLIDLPSVTNAPLVSALDPKRHFVAKSRSSTRHRVTDNLLGDGNLCPIVRRSIVLEQAVSQQLDKQVREIASQYTPEMLHCATDYLYTRETRSSFDIEGETPDNAREERFLQSLRKADTFDARRKESLIELQRIILEERFADSDWRKTQVYVGTRKMRGRQYVHYICPRPEDVPDLMEGFYTIIGRALESEILDPIIAAAVVAFAFVFIHPLEDGNGRLHRFLIHNILARRRFTPDGLIFPVSAAILRDQEGYYRVLDGFSLPIKPCIHWEFYGDDEIAVTNLTRDLYRFFDATPLAEFLYDKVEETVRHDFQQELDYLTRYDAAFLAVQKIADMKDKDLSLLVRLCLQNEGILSKSKRKLFPLLHDSEISQMEQAIQAILSPS